MHSHLLRANQNARHSWLFETELDYSIQVGPSVTACSFYGSLLNQNASHGAFTMFTSSRLQRASISPKVCSLQVVFDVTELFKQIA